jgi:hypothetical protein
MPLVKLFIDITTIQIKPKRNPGILAWYVRKDVKIAAAIPSAPGFPYPGAEIIIFILWYSSRGIMIPFCSAVSGLTQ